MAETPLHRDNMIDLIEMLRNWYQGNDRVYVSGNMFLYYEPGNRRRHVSPDVFVVLDVPKLPERKVFLTWEEGKCPDLVVEVSSKSTRKEDLKDKFALYRDKLSVPEYFLFDPEEEYLKPSLQGYRLQAGEYRPIEFSEGRLPSTVLGLHLERSGERLRLYDPATKQRVLLQRELLEQEKTARVMAETACARAEAEVERLRQTLESLRQRPNGSAEAP